MPVTKTTRFQVLRRDGHTCRYCGAKAPDVLIRVDHVIPVALGGSDKPDNLVAACVDCNAGKAASNPDAGMVADVADDAIRWAAAMRAAVEAESSRIGEARSLVEHFTHIWDGWR